MENVVTFVLEFEQKSPLFFAFISITGTVLMYSALMLSSNEMIRREASFSAVMYFGLELTVFGCTYVYTAIQYGSPTLSSLAALTALCALKICRLVVSGLPK